MLTLVLLLLRLLPLIRNSCNCSQTLRLPRLLPLRHKPQYQHLLPQVSPANTHRQQHQLHLRHPPQQHQRPLIIPLCKLPLRPAAPLYHTRLKAQTLVEQE